MKSRGPQRSPTDAGYGVKHRTHARAEVTGGQTTTSRRLQSECSPSSGFTGIQPPRQANQKSIFVPVKLDNNSHKKYTRTNLFFSSMYNQNCSADRTSLEAAVEQKSVAERTKMKECTTTTGLWWTRSAIWWWRDAERLLPSDHTRASIELKTWRRPSVQHSCQALTDANTQPRISST